jgi:CheY-like chemotaxis protein
MQTLIQSSKLQANSKAIADTYLQETQGGRFRHKQTYAVADIYKAGFSACYIEVLEEYEAKAYAIVPIFQGQKLWGMLAAYENKSPREWEESQVKLLAQIGDQLGIALQQAEYLQQLQTQSAQLAEAAAKDKAAKELLQKGAMQLLSAVRPALNGDLTVRAPITEDELGTIADAYNNTLQALRQIVIQVQSAAQQVAQTSSNSDASLTTLTTLAKQQLEEITEALSEIQQMVDSTQGVVANAELVQVYDTVVKSNPVLLLRRNQEVLGLEVDQIIGEQELVIRPLGNAIAPPKYVYACSSLANGTLILVIDSALLLQSGEMQATLDVMIQPTAHLLKKKALPSGLTGSTTPLLNPSAASKQPSQLAKNNNSLKVILVVDDAISLRQTLSLTLQKSGYQVLQAENGVDALEKLEQHPEIKVVISDLEMPRMNGFELLSNIRQNPKLIKKPVVVLTSRSADKHRQLAQALGANAYLTKPYLENEFLSTVENLISRDVDDLTQLVLHN